MASRKDALTFLLVSSIFLFAISLPYLAAARAGGEDHIFTGLLQNPVDGNSYLAKMYQGWRGDWTFTLPYTADPGEGTYIFLFYLFLGHLARISGLSTILVFHLARMASATFMLLALWRFYSATLARTDSHRLAFAMAGLGSGLGWLAAFAGGFTADFWVGEAYPFLGAYANPHFPLGLALALSLVTPSTQGREVERRFYWVQASLIGLALGVVMPFGVVVAAMVLAGAIVLEKSRMKFGPIPGGPPQYKCFNEPVSIFQQLRSRFQSQPESYQRLSGLLAGGVPVLFYDFWVANMHPVLSGWNAQNLTPAPPLWDIALSFSPALWLAFTGAWIAWHSRDRGPQLLLVWAVLGLILLYLPLGLQRRFILGLYVPLAGLAALGVCRLAKGDRRRGTILVIAFFLLALPTNGMILLASAHGMEATAAPLYMGRDEYMAMEWVQANTPEGSVFLAAPETGLWIPAQTGRRVVAGHPFETVEAEQKARQVEAIFRGSPETRKISWIEEVDYTFIGPSERDLGGNLPAGDWHLVYDRGGVKIWRKGQ